MNYKKAYSEIIAEIMKDGSRVFFDEMDDTGYIAVVPTGYYAFVFPKYKFLLNTECMTITTNITKICQRENCADALTWTGVVKQNKKIILRNFCFLSPQKSYFMLPMKKKKSFNSGFVNGTLRRSESTVFVS